MMKMQATVYSVQKAVGPNGEVYIKTFVGNPAKADDVHTKGLELMSISTEPSVFDALSKTDQPFLADLELVFQRGGQNKMKQHLVSITPVAKAAGSSTK